MSESLTAQDVFTAIRQHVKGAVIPEVVLSVPEYHELHGLDPRIKPFRRIDGLGFESFIRTAFEIKVSVRDMKRDHPYKWMPWANVVHRFIYVIPEGMCDQADVIRATGNYSAGVWSVGGDGRVTVLRKAKVAKTPEPLPQQIVQALAYRLAALSQSLPPEEEEEETPHALDT